MRKSLIVAFALACFGVISAGHLALSEQCPSEHVTTLKPAEKILSRAFPCLQRGSARLNERDGRKNLSASAYVLEGDNVFDPGIEVSSITIDEAHGMVQLVTPSSLRFGNVEGLKFTILFKNQHMILAQSIVDRETPIFSIIVIDKDTSQIIELNSIRTLDNGFTVNSNFYECKGTSQ